MDQDETTEKTCVKRPLSKYNKLVFKTNYRLMQIKSIAKCSKGSILIYFRPSLSYHLSLRSLFVYLLVAVLHRSYCTDMRAVCSGFTVFASLIQSKCVVCTTCLLMFAGNLYDANNIGAEQSDQSL